MPFSLCSPLPSKASPEPATRSLTIWESVTVRLRTPSVNLPGEMISVVINRMNGYFPDWRFSETEPHEALVVLRCPQCTKQGAFESSGSYDHGGVADDGVAIVG